MQQNRDTEKDTHLWSINFQKNTKIMQWGMMILSTNGAGKVGYPYAKSEPQDGSS